jgi:hypothetical protein
MIDLDGIVDAVNREAERHADPRERQRAILAVLRRELDAVPVEQLPLELARLRERLAPADRGSEGARLWEAISGGEVGAGSRAEARAVGADELSKLLLGAEWKNARASSPEVAERLIGALRRIVGLVTQYDDAMRDLNIDLRTHTMLEGRSGGTLMGLKLEAPIGKLLTRAVLETDDFSELERRLESLKSAVIFIYHAHRASVRAMREDLKRLLDPQAIQREHGNKAWEAYRQIFHRDLLDMAPDFEEQFVTRRFLKEYFRSLDAQR